MSLSRRGAKFEYIPFGRQSERGRAWRQTKAIFSLECRAYGKRKSWFCVLIFPWWFPFQLWVGGVNRLFQHHMRDNYRVPKYQPASVSPKYSRPKLGVTSMELNLLFGMKPSQTNRYSKVKFKKEGLRDFVHNDRQRCNFKVIGMSWIMWGEIKAKVVEKTKSYTNWEVCLCSICSIYDSCKSV